MKLHCSVRFRFGDQMFVIFVWLSWVWGASIGEIENSSVRRMSTYEVKGAPMNLGSGEWSLSIMARPKRPYSDNGIAPGN